MQKKCHSQNHVNLDGPSLLRNAGLKLTKPRLAILNLMLSEHGPYTAEEWHARLGSPSRDQHCDVVTMYRCLAKFESEGLISRCDFGDGLIRYELRSKDHHHHHIICRQCRRVESLPECQFDNASLKLPTLGFKDISHRLEFFGLCPDCS